MFDAVDFIQYLTNTISLELIKRQDRLKETQRVVIKREVEGCRDFDY